MQLNLNLKKIKDIIGVDSNSDDSILIKNIASLENATENDMAVVFDRGSESVFSSVEVEKIKNSKAGIILCDKEIVVGKQYLITPNALTAFSKIVNFIKNSDSKDFIDSTAVISKKSNLHESVRIGFYSVICDYVTIGEFSIIDSNVFIGKNSSIGKNVKIYSGVKILDGTIIGDNSIIHANAVIGSDGFGYNISKAGLQKVPQIGIVQIGSNVEIGSCTAIDRAAFDKTIIGDGCKIDNLVQIAHNVIIGPHTVILAQTGIAGGVRIGVGCQIGGQVAIKDHITIGNGAKIVSKSGVMKSVKDGAVVAGIPAMPFSKWKRSAALFSMLPDYLKKMRDANSNKIIAKPFLLSFNIFKRFKNICFNLFK